MLLLDLSNLIDLLAAKRKNKAIGKIDELNLFFRTLSMSSVAKAENSVFKVGAICLLGFLSSSSATSLSRRQVPRLTS